jgi:hypothetical protein
MRNDPNSVIVLSNQVILNGIKVIHVFENLSTDIAVAVCPNNAHLLPILNNFISNNLNTVIPVLANLNQILY